MFKVLATVLCAAAVVSARIRAIVPFSETFHATESSTLSVTFETVNGATPLFDWSAAIGVMPIANRIDATALGHFVANVDFHALGKSSTGTDTFSVTIPVNTSVAITSGSGEYVLTAAIMSSSGAQELAFAKILNATFSATTQ